MINLTGAEKSPQDGMSYGRTYLVFTCSKVNSENNRKCEICSKLTKKKPDQRH